MTGTSDSSQRVTALARRQRQVRRQLKRSLKRRAKLQGRDPAQMAPFAKAQQKTRHMALKCVAPVVFSIQRDPKATLDFLSRVRDASSRRNVFIDLGEVEEITPEAIGALVAIIIHEKENEGTSFEGNYPIAVNAREIVEQCDFPSHFRHRRGQPPAKATRGILKRNQGKKSDGPFAASLNSFAANALVGTESLALTRASYVALVEVMANTHTHAGPRQGEAKWWASVYVDQSRNTACYTFVDLGVGILGSAKVNAIRRLLNKVGYAPDSEILRDLFHRRIPSRTGQPFRGHGLPNILKQATRGGIQSLFVATNGVTAKVSEHAYQDLPSSFPGTLWYWEVKS